MHHNHTTAGPDARRCSARYLWLQLASLVRGVMAQPGWRQQAPACQLLADGAGLLQQRLRTISQPVLMKLLAGLAAHSKQAVVVQAQPDAGAPDEHSQAVLVQLLGSCVAEWQKPSRLQHVSPKQAEALVAALEACGQHSAAAAAQQALAAHAAQRELRPPRVVHSAPTEPQSSWVDSFVAGAD